MTSKHVAQDKFAAYLREHKIKAGECANKIGMTKSSLMNKIYGITDFKWEEINTICQVYKIKNPLDIFV